jgi:hypothetical protein
MKSLYIKKLIPLVYFGVSFILFNGYVNDYCRFTFKMKDLHKLKIFHMLNGWPKEERYYNGVNKLHQKSLNPIGFP